MARISHARRTDCRTTRNQTHIRVAIVLMATLLTLLGTAGTASAHSGLTESDPADRATLDTAPTAITLTFNEPIRNIGATIVVTGPNGNVFTQDNNASVKGNVLSARVEGAGPAGDYKIAYRIVSADGHAVTGQTTYTLSTAAAGSATGTPPGNNIDADAASGLPTWTWIALAVVAAGIAAIAINLVTRSKRS